jgi:multiple PDZ domain protein
MDVSAKYNDLDGSIQLVELQRGAAGLGLSLAGNRDRKKMSVFVCGLHPRGSAFIDGRIKGNTSLSLIRSLR